MKFLQLPLRFSYALSRRLGIIDAAWLLHMSKDKMDLPDRPCGYQMRAVPMGELAELRRSGLVNLNVGDPSDLEEHTRVLVGAFADDRLVSFAWFAKQSVATKDNYCRAVHLGSSIELPEGSAFVYNAWTDTDHRGKRLMAGLLQWSIRNRVADGWSLSTTIDWSNESSCRAFEHLGMQKIGLIVRIGRGPMQLSLVPSSAQRVGLRIAADAPGIKLTL